MDEQKLVCKKCGNDDPECWIAIEYNPLDENGKLNSYHYDGISEWRCMRCEARYGRWSGKLLAEGEYEPPFGKRR